MRQRLRSIPNFANNGGLARTCVAPTDTAGWVGFQTMGQGLRATNFNDTRLTSCHPGVIVVGLGDGSTRAVSVGVSVMMRLQGCNPADGATLVSDW